VQNWKFFTFAPLASLLERPSMRKLREYGIVRGFFRSLLARQGDEKWGAKFGLW
jgi:hypothetical protein